MPLTRMSAPWLMVGASLLFATMGLCVKLSSAGGHGLGEIVFVRGAVGALIMAAFSRQQRIPLKTPVPAMHLWRSIVGVSALSLWFYAMATLPLATAVTLNYMSSVWMALFLLGGAIMMGGQRIDWRLMLTVLVGFGGVALMLRPTLERDQLWHGLIGLMSGVLSAMAYLQVTALGRAGEPETRVVFYFSLGSTVMGLAMAVLGSGFHAPTFATVLSLVGAGAFATVAQLMMTRAYAVGKPLVNASLQYLGIPFSFVFGVLVFNDPVTPMAIAGMLLIIGAGLAATRLRQATAPPRADDASGLFRD